MVRRSSHALVFPPSPAAPIEEWLRWRKYLEGLGRERPLVRDAICEAEEMIVRLNARFGCDGRKVVGG